MIKPRPALFKWRHFEPEIILCAVRWYLRFSLSYRDVEELDVLQKRFCRGTKQICSASVIQLFNPSVSRMNRVCPMTSAFGSHLTWPFRIICTIS